MQSSQGCATAPVPITCQHTLGFLPCWESAASLMAPCTDVCSVSSASGGPGSLKGCAASDGLGDRVQVNDHRGLNQAAWWWHLGCQAPVTLPALEINWSQAELIALWPAVLTGSQYPAKATLAGK